MKNISKRAALVSISGAMMVGPWSATAMASGNDDTSTVKDEDTTTYDLVIENGNIVDGTGSSAYTADIGVKNGYIYDIGDLTDAEAEKVVDAEGKVVSPGFIDLHSHADESALQVAKSSLTQGVTTELLNPDGFGNASISDKLELKDDGLAINIAPYIGFNAVWEEVVGEDDRAPTEEEIEQMQNLVTQAMEDGAWGISSGLTYTPGAFAETADITRVVSAADEWRTNFPSHIRNENDQVIEATEEIIEIGEQAGVNPVITHMKIMGPDNWGKSMETINLLEEANERGTYAAGDVYPYIASQTGLTAIVPPWVEDGGAEAMLERFNDEELRPQIENEIEELIQSRGEGPQDVYFPGESRTLEDIATEMGVSPGEATMRLLEENEGGYVRTIYYFGSDEDFERILQHPNIAVASDGGATTSESIHPRRYGTQPRVLGQFTREEQLLDLEEAVYKMTGLPATMVGMTDRGIITEGMKADITVFDEEEVIDQSTFDVPKQYAEGIERVYVNGELALEDGEPTGVQVGEALTRESNMPSRRASFQEKTSIEAEGKLMNVTPPRNQRHKEFSLELDKNDQGATVGNISFSDKNEDIYLQSEDIGELQTRDGWASTTGKAVVDESGQEKTFSVIIDEDDPTVQGNRVAVTVQIENGYEYTGVLAPNKVNIND